MKKHPVNTPKKYPLMKTLFTFRRFDRLKDYLQDKYSIVQPLKLERDMKNFLLFAIGISLCILVSCQQTSSHKPFVELSSLELSEEEMPMVSISNDFACSFFQKMNEQEKGQSFFISPLSAQFNLGMLANGAAGKTLEEIASVLSVSKSKPSLANNYFLKAICLDWILRLSFSQPIPSGFMTNHL